MKPLRKLGIVGAGNMSAQYVFHALRTSDVSLVVSDINDRQLEVGRQVLADWVNTALRQMAKSIPGFDLEEERSKTNAAIDERVTWTTDIGAFSGAQLIVEAATEHREAKQKIFADLDRVAPDAVKVTNSSHYPISDFTEGLSRPEMCCGLHGFYGSSLVEIIPAKGTHSEVVSWLRDTVRGMGRPTILLDREQFGFVLNPIIELMAREAILLVEEGVASTGAVDFHAFMMMKMKAPPFALLNRLNANGIVKVGLEGYRERGLMPWVSVPDLLERQIESGESWRECPRKTVPALQHLPASLFHGRTISDRLIGAYLAAAGWVIDHQLTSNPVVDVERGCKDAFKARSPLERIREFGPARARAMVEAFAERNSGYEVSEWIKEVTRSKSAGKLASPAVVSEVRDGVALLWLQQSFVGPDEVKALHDELDKIAGTGMPFVILTEQDVAGRGANLKYMYQIRNDPKAQTRFLGECQRLLRRIYEMEEPSVLAAHGVCLGFLTELGGFCSRRVISSTTLIGLPEVTKGLLPGLNGIGVLQRLCDSDRAARLARTGKFASVHEVDGYASDIVSGAVLVSEAIRIAGEMKGGGLDSCKIENNAVVVPSDELTRPADLVGLSRAVDARMQRLIEDSARATFLEGLDLSGAAFADVFKMRPAQQRLEEFAKKGKERRFADALKV